MPLEPHIACRHYLTVACQQPVEDLFWERHAHPYTERAFNLPLEYAIGGDASYGRYVPNAVKLESEGRDVGVRGGDQALGSQVGLASGLSTGEACSPLIRAAFLRLTF